MSTDLELNDWRAEWQAQVRPEEANSAGVRHNAIRQQRRLRARHISELLAGLIFLASSTGVAWNVPGVESFVWAAVVWLTTFVVTAFSIWNWHILWKADLKSVSEFTQEYEKRCLAELRAARFGMVFLVVQTAISAPWLTWDYYRGHLTTTVFGGSMILLFCLIVGFRLMFSRYRKTALRELQEVQDVRNALGDFSSAERSDPGELQ